MNKAVHFLSEELIVEATEVEYKEIRFLQICFIA